MAIHRIEILELALETQSSPGCKTRWIPVAVLAVVIEVQLIVRLRVTQKNQVQKRVATNQLDLPNFKADCVRGFLTKATGD